LELLYLTYEPNNSYRRRNQNHQVHQQWKTKYFRVHILTTRKDEHSESATEKLYEQVLSSENTSSKHQKNHPDRVIGGRKINSGEGQQKNKD
jgi:hypothetical protein